jgi:hypothetical protein
MKRVELRFMLKIKSRQKKESSQEIKIKVFRPNLRVSISWLTTTED